MDCQGGGLCIQADRFQLFLGGIMQSKNRRSAMAAALNKKVLQAIYFIFKLFYGHR